MVLGQNYSCQVLGKSESMVGAILALSLYVQRMG